MTKTQCVACGKEVVATVMVVKDYYFSHENFDILKCGFCGMGETYPKPGRDVLAQYYAPEKYVSHQSLGGGLFLSVYRMVQKINLQLKKCGIVRQGNRGGHLLDIGCGNGSALKYFNAEGWKGVGVEPAEGARALAVKEGAAVYDESFLDSCASESFDLITMWHVMEHVYDLNERFSQVRRLIRPEGLFVMALPNHESFDARFYKESWAAWDVPRHLYHFSQKAVVLMAEKGGFEVVAVKPMWFDSFYVSLSSEQYRKTGLLGSVRALFIGLWSNLIANYHHQGTSSLIYYLKPRV